MYTNSGNFQTSVVFNKQEWAKEEVHMAALKSDENYSANGASTNLYFMQPEHTMQIRTTLSTEQEVQDVLSKIPCIEQFKFIIIE